MHLEARAAAARHLLAEDRCQPEGLSLSQLVQPPLASQGVQIVSMEGPSFDWWAEKMCYLRSRGRTGRACEVVTLPVAGCRPGSNRAERIGTRSPVVAA